MAENRNTPEQDLQADADAGVLPTAREKKLQDLVVGYERVVKNLDMRRWVVERATGMYSGKVYFEPDEFERVLKIIDGYVSPTTERDD
jgi:hypothetical protein